MKVITCNYQLNFNLIPLHKDDLVWVSCVQNPFGMENYYLMNNHGVWEIPCELCRIDEVYVDIYGHIWGVSVFDANNKNESIGLHIEDIIQNHTYNLWNKKIHKSYDIITSYYKIRYNIRKIMANRIQRQYIQYYWNPTNPNMQQRLLNDYNELITCLPPSSLNNF